MFRGASATFLLLLVGTLLVSRTEAEVLYELTDLGGLGGGETRAQDVNNNGEAIGHSRIIVDQVATWHAYWSDGVAMHDLGTLGGKFSYGYGVNDSRQVVGYSEQAAADGGRTRAFRWTDVNGNGEADPNEMIDLGTLGGFTSVGRAINAAGQVVGGAEADVGLLLKRKRAFLWTDDNSNNQADPNEMINLGTLGTYPFDESEAWGVNTEAAVVGVSFVTGGVVHAFYWHDDNDNGQSDPNEMIDLGTLGGTSSHAYDINDDYEVVGVTTTGDGASASRAFLWRDANENGAADPNEMSDLGTLGGRDSTAFAMNNFGEIVGWADRPDPNDPNNATADSPGAFVYRDEQMFDLNTLVDVNLDVDPNNDWKLDEAYAISDAGHIVGVGKAAGRPGQAFLLTPKSGGPGLPGDVNGDGQVNYEDVDPFMDVLLNGPYRANADINGDDLVNGLDVELFVSAVRTGGVRTIPEPPTVLLAAIGVFGLAGCGWRRKKQTSQAAEWNNHKG